MFSVLGSKSLLNCPAALSKTAFGKRIILGNCLRRFFAADVNFMSSCTIHFEKEMRF